MAFSATGGTKANVGLYTVQHQKELINIKDAGELK